MKKQWCDIAFVLLALVMLLMSVSLSAKDVWVSTFSLNETVVDIVQPSSVDGGVYFANADIAVDLYHDSEAKGAENMTKDASENADFGIWGYFTVNKHIVSGLSFSLSGEVRSANTVEDLGLWYINPAISFKFNDYFSVLAGYRYANSIKSGVCEQIHRWYAGASAGIGIGPMRLVLREMIEQYHYTDRPQEHPVRMITYLRSRLRADFKFDSFFLRPYAEAENFLYIIGYRNGEIGHMRYTVGTKISVTKVHSFDIYYRYQYYYGSSKPNDHVLGLGYILSF